MKVWLLLIGAIALDQITKHRIRISFTLGQSIPVLGDFVRLTYVENPGIAFGIRVRFPWIFTFLAFVASVYLAWLLYRNRHQRLAVTGSLTLILAGAIGNLIDRLFFRQVVDFIDVGIGTLRWPVFNVADSLVVIGMGWFFLMSLRKPHDFEKTFACFPNHVERGTSGNPRAGQ